MTLAPGTRLAHYEIVSALDSGGMGVVYRARDPRLDRDVAVKVLSDRLASDPDMRARFEQEARSLAALSHPNILAIHELAVFEGLPVAVMELLTGENLRARLSRGPLTWRDAVPIAAAVADGLAAAHARGIVHRDLKPENVFLTAHQQVKILDFGLAHRTLAVAASDSPTVVQTRPGLILGTIGYLAPEQIQGRALDGRTDIFALGCMLFEMVARRRSMAPRRRSRWPPRCGRRCRRSSRANRLRQGSSASWRTASTSVPSGGSRPPPTSRRPSAPCSRTRPDPRRRSAAPPVRTRTRSRCCRSSTPGSTPMPST